MRKIATFSFLLTIALITSLSVQAQEPSKQVAKGDIYEYAPINWQIEIPKGFTVMSANYEQHITQLGSDMLEDATGVALDLDSVKNLLNYSKNPQNAFLSVIEPHKSTLKAFKNKKHIEAELLYAMLEDQGLFIDTSTGTKVVNGKEFQMIYVKLYFDASKEDVVLTQDYYSLLIGHDKVFYVIITSNNEGDKQQMQDAWYKSISAIKQ